MSQCPSTFAARHRTLQESQRADEAFAALGREVSVAARFLWRACLSLAPANEGCLEALQCHLGENATGKQHETT